MTKRRNVEDLEDSVVRANELGVIGGKSTGFSSSIPPVPPVSAAPLVASPAVPRDVPPPPIPRVEPVQEVSSGGGESSSQTLTKSTFYLRDEDILALDEIQSADFRRTRKRPDRSQLVREAIQLLYRTRQGI